MLRFACLRASNIRPLKFNANLFARQRRTTNFIKEAETSAPQVKHTLYSIFVNNILKYHNKKLIVCCIKNVVQKPHISNTNFYDRLDSRLFHWSKIDCGLLFYWSWRYGLQRI